MTRTVVFHVVYALHIGGLERVLVNTISRMPQNYQHIVICLTSYSESFASLLPENTELIALSKREGHAAEKALVVHVWCKKTDETAM